MHSLSLFWHDWWIPFCHCVRLRTTQMRTLLKAFLPPVSHRENPGSIPRKGKKKKKGNLPRNTSMMRLSTVGGGDFAYDMLLQYLIRRNWRPRPLLLHPPVASNFFFSTPPPRIFPTSAFSGLPALNNNSFEGNQIEWKSSTCNFRHFPILPPLFSLYLLSRAPKEIFNFKTFFQFFVKSLFYLMPASSGTPNTEAP